jgi:hypothetical protein
MIAANKSSSLNTKSEIHAAFLQMLPTIRRSAQIAFRKVSPELRHELLAEVVARCFVAYVRLVESGQADRALPSPLARFAVAQVRVGRRVGNRMRIGDVLSGYAQYHKDFQVERLDYFDEKENCWQEVLVEDKRATPAVIAACRIDFSSWLRLLPHRRRTIALALAGGETTSGAAKMFGLSAARISQHRQWLKESWEAFQGEVKNAEEPQLAAA